jgi:hypothetical protein
MMNNVLDIAWIKILDLIHYMVRVLDFVFEPFNALGPGVAVFVAAMVAVGVSTLVTKVFKTKRYQRLKQEFQYWYQLRQEALKCADPEKAKALTKNIDQGKLNEVYYNYFFEGFLNSLATRHLPILIFLAYVNETYKSDNLMLRFGRDYIFRFRIGNHDPIVIGAVFWFVIALLLVYLILSMLRRWGPDIFFRKRLARIRRCREEG